MISLAAVMSNPVSRGAPCARPPRPVMTFRRFRSFMSMQRRQEIASGSRPGRVPVMEVRVDQRREQVVRGRDRVQVAGEVQVQVLHRDDLRVAAAGSAALHAEHRPERRLAQAEDRLAAELAETLRERDRRRRLPLARRRRRDRRDVDQLRVGPVGEPVDHGEVDLRLVAAVRLDLVVEESELVGDVADRAEASRPGRSRGWRASSWLIASPFSDSPLPRPARRRGCRCGTAPSRTARSDRASSRSRRARRA